MNKQIKKLIIIIVAIVVVVALAFVALFVFDDSGDSSGDSAGGASYELMKTKLVETLRVRDGEAATIADIFFNDIGISNFESISSGGRKGNVTIMADGYKMDCRIISGTFDNMYIGNALIYRNPKSTAVISGNYVEFSYNQYQTQVQSLARNLKIEETAGKNLFEEMTLIGVNGFTNIKKGKLNDTAGFYGYDGSVKYFMQITSSGSIHSIYIISNGLDPFEVYNATSGLNTVVNSKFGLPGRVGLGNVLSIKVKQASGLDITLPLTLASGDDSWMIVDNGSVIYAEVSSEVKNGDKTKVEDVVIKADSESREIIYLKIGRKVYVGS